jgi:hypothetical protein
MAVAIPLKLDCSAAMVLARMVFTSLRLACSKICCAEFSIADLTWSGISSRTWQDCAHDETAHATVKNAKINLKLSLFIIVCPKTVLLCWYSKMLGGASQMFGALAISP